MLGRAYEAFPVGLQAHAGPNQEASPPLTSRGAVGCFHPGHAHPKKAHAGEARGESVAIEKLRRQHRARGVRRDGKHFASGGDGPRHDRRGSTQGGWRLSYVELDCPGVVRERRGIVRAGTGAEDRTRLAVSQGCGSDWFGARRVTAGARSLRPDDSRLLDEPAEK